MPRLMPRLTLGHALAAVLLAAAPASAQVLTGPAAYGDWHGDAPGVTRLIRPADLPPPSSSRSVSNGPSVLAPGRGDRPHVPPGFSATLFASGLQNPRMIRTAPGGDVFLTETAAGRIRILRTRDGADRPELNEVFAAGLELPFGLAFWPPGPQPRYLYVGTLNAVLRFPWRPGDLRPTGRPETIVPRLTSDAGNHVTRDVQFTADGKRLLVSIGSASNVAESMARKNAAGTRRLGGGARRGRVLGPRDQPRRGAGLRPGRRQPHRLRHRPAQLRGPGGPPGLRRHLVLD